MSLSINSKLFTETGTDSDDLNVLGTLVHQFSEQGEYVATVTRDGDEVGEELLVVDDEYHSRQASVDLSSVGPTAGGADCSCEAESFQCIRPDGYAVFHVPSGPGGYGVTVAPLSDCDETEFEGSELTESDRFAVTLMRPGTYTVENLACDVEGRIEVAYPDPDDRGGGAGDPVEVETSTHEFEPSAVTVDPGQGVVFDVRERSHIRVELESPHEDATEDPDDRELVSQSRPGLPDDETVDPDDLSIDDILDELEAITRPDKLRALLFSERAGENRDEAIDAIKERLTRLYRDDD